MDSRVRVLLVWMTGPAISFAASHLVALIYRQRFSSITPTGQFAFALIACIPFIAPGIFFAKIRDLDELGANSINCVRGLASYVPAVISTAALFSWSAFVEVNTIPGQGAPMSGILVIAAVFPLALVSGMVGLSFGRLSSQKK